MAFATRSQFIRFQNETQRDLRTAWLDRCDDRRQLVETQIAMNALQEEQRTTSQILEVLKKDVENLKNPIKKNHRCSFCRGPGHTISTCEMRRKLNRETAR